MAGPALRRLIPVVGFSLTMAAGTPVLLARSAAQATRQEPRVNPDAQTMAAFQARLAAYVDLHRKQETTLPPLPKDATPEAIDTHQQALERLVTRARASAKAGDLMDEKTRHLIRVRLATLLATPAGADIRALILDDDNPGNIKLAINARYPDDAPLATTPPEVLEILPPLPDELEYRFVGRGLVLLDVHARTVADSMDNAISR